MPLTTELLLVKTKGNDDIINITPNIETFIDKHRVKNASLNVSVVGSTASITNIEYEPGLIIDFPNLLNQLVPNNYEYKHNVKWDENNAYSYLRASILGNSRTFAVCDGEIQIGTSQQIVLIDFDNKQRVRKLVLQLFE